MWPVCRISKELPDPALFTDDTQMSIAVAKALILAAEKDIDAIMADMKLFFTCLTTDNMICEKNV